MATLIIERSSSKCGECRWDANPNSTYHDVILGYSRNGEPGCGAVWTEVYVPYHDGLPDLEGRIKQIYPNLEGIPFIDMPFSV